MAIHPSSVNHSVRQFSSPFLVYHEKVRSTLSAETHYRSVRLRHGGSVQAVLEVCLLIQSADSTTIFVHHEGFADLCLLIHPRDPATGSLPPVRRL